MSFDFSKIAELSTARGKLVELKNSAGRVIWAVKSAATDEPAAIFEVAKQTKTTYAGETKYENEEFVLFDIYPKKGGTVKVTYGGLTKTITDTSGAEEPNAQQVYFGTFNGVADEVETPASGTLTIEGAYRGYGMGSYGSSSGKSSGTYAPCITNVIDFGNPVYIGDRAFKDCANFTPSSLPSGITSIGAYAFHGCGANLALTELPSGLTSIGTYAFYGCTNLALTELPSGITSIGEHAFKNCFALNIDAFPEGLVNIGDEAFYMNTKVLENIAMYKKTITFPSTVESIGSSAFGSGVSANVGEGLYCTYIEHVVILAPSPPTTATDTFGDRGLISITVPTGCGEVYKAAEGWIYYKRIIVEAS